MLGHHVVRDAITVRDARVITEYLPPQINEGEERLDTRAVKRQSGQRSDSWRQGGQWLYASYLPLKGLIVTFISSTTKKFSENNLFIVIQTQHV